MNIKMQVYKNIKTRLEEDQKKLRQTVERNKWEMRKITTKQTVAKRELAAIQELIKTLPTH